jgi:ATP-dependent exoDNAse (exonuclease V) beta subunit
MDEKEELILKLEQKLAELRNREKNAIINIELSEEQTNIINSSDNMIINAVAGSGKSTVIIHFALKYPEKKMIQITYNNMLKQEIRKKVRILGLKNLTVHTYHSLAVNFYNFNAYTDEEIKRILITDTKCKNTEKYDVILIDETQDMMFDYFYLLKKFIKDTNSKPQLLIFGDSCQGIYEFKGANSKFLTLANRIWDNTFNIMTLTTSFRITKEIAWFINNCMLNHNRINSIKSGPKIDYYICNSYKIYETIGKSLINMIKNEKIKEEDIFILSPSIKSENPYKFLENYMVLHGYKCMTPISDDAKLDDKIINNKIVFTTYHQSKGRERKVVVLYNFDNSYFEYYLKDENRLRCPNILYVGATRVMEKLILIQDFKNKQLDFLNLEHKDINNYINIYKTEENIANKIVSRNNNDHKTNVTELIKFIDSYILDNIIMLLENMFINIYPIKKIVSVPCRIEILNDNKKTFEDVSDLNGLVIPSIYEKIINNSSTIENYVLKLISKNSKKTKKFQNNDQNIIKKYIKNLNVPCKSISDFLKVGNIYISKHNGLHSKLAQITKYNWLSKKMITECHKNMEFLNNKKLIFEKSISNCDEDIFKITHKEFGKIIINGRIDAYDDENVYEFKCVDSISIDHKLQLILYQWLWKKSNLFINEGNKNFKLLNIKTGEMLQLVNDDYKINQIVELILANKFVKKNTLNDDEFIKYIQKNDMYKKYN